MVRGEAMSIGEECGVERVRDIGGKSGTGFGVRLLDAGISNPSMHNVIRV